MRLGDMVKDLIRLVVRMGRRLVACSTPARKRASICRLMMREISCAGSDGFLYNNHTFG